jgi:LPS-assembly protein
VTGNFIYHFQSYQANTRNVIDEPLLQRNVVMRLDLVGPVFNRIFRDRRGEAKVKHIVEPYASYNFDSPVAGANRIITATGMFFRYHQVSYGLNNRFLVKQGGRTREAISVGVGQTYYIAYEDSPLSRFKIDGEIPRFSEISGFVRYRPVGLVTLDASAGYNPYTKQVGSIRLGAGLGSQATDNAFMSVNWYKSMNSWRENLGGWESYYFRHQIGVSGGLKLPRAGLELMGDVDFNIQEKSFLYTAASILYHYQCSDIGAEVKVFYFRYMDQPDVQFRINLGLGNIGKTTDFLGGFDF